MSRGEPIGVELLECFAGSQDASLVEGVLDGLLGVQHGAGQWDADLDGHRCFLAFDDRG
jgi:hypothetical protein